MGYKSKVEISRSGLVGKLSGFEFEFRFLAPKLDTSGWQANTEGQKQEDHWSIQPIIPVNSVKAPVSEAGEEPEEEEGNDGDDSDQDGEQRKVFDIDL